MASPNYKKTNPIFDVKNFSGFFCQIHLNGKVDRIFGIENGKFIAKVTIDPHAKFNTNKLITRCFCCECWNSAINGVGDQIRCFLCSLGSSIGDFFTIQNDSAPDTGINGGGTLPIDNWNLGFGFGADVGYNSGGPNNGGSTSSGSSTGGSTGVSQIDELSDNIDNTMFESMLQNRYIEAGFSFSEYNALRADNELFLHVDMFMNKHIGDYDAQQHAKDMATRALTDSDLRDAIVAWNPFIVEICKELAYDLLWELFKKHAPGLKDKAIIESMIQNLKTGSYLDLTHDVLQIAKRYVPWDKFIDIAWDGFEYGKKFEKA